MATLEISDLVDLVEVPEAEDRIEKMFDWTFERRKIIVQAVLAFLGAFIVALFASFAKGEFKDLVIWQVVLFVLVSVGGTSVIGGRYYWRLRLLEREFLTAIWLYNDISDDISGP